MLDHAFTVEGFTVVRGPDVIWGGDIRTFRPPPGVFDGIIGGDPCQSHSSLANLVRAKGLEPSFPDMTPEYKRVVEEARPAWFLRENVPKAPDIKPDGYDVRAFMLDNSTLDSGDGWGNEQMRKRRWWYGVRDGECPELRQWIDFALFELPDAVQAVAGDARSVPVAMGGSGKRKATAISCDGRTGHRVNDGTGGTAEGNFRARRKVTAVGGHDGHSDQLGAYKKSKQRAVTGELGRRLKQTGGKGIEAYEQARKAPPVTGRNEGAVGAPGKDYSPPRRDLAEMLRLQGFPPDWLDHQPWTMQAKRKMVGNGVALPMGRALARAIRKAFPA